MSVVTIRDEASGSRAAIAVDRGFNCYQFIAVVGEQEVDVLAAEPGFESGSGRPSQYGNPILFPFPNRIREGKYTWEGHDYQLPLAEGHTNAIHGFCYDRPWRVVEEGDNFVVGQFQLSVDALSLLELWPSDFVIEVRYSVAGAALKMQVTVTNPGEKPLPWGFGTHAYFKLPLGRQGEKNACRIHAPAGEKWGLEECLPTGEREPVTEREDLRAGVSLAGRHLDDVLTGLTAKDGRIETVIADPLSGLKVTQSFSDEFRELVAFTPSWTDAVCLEPYTCVTDAINLQPKGVDAGWRTLGPSEVWESEIVIRVASL